jgi:hypothetical protein
LPGGQWQVRLQHSEWAPIPVLNILVGAKDCGRRLGGYQIHSAVRWKLGSATPEANIVDIATGTVRHHGYKGWLEPIGIQELRHPAAENSKIVG